MRGQRHTPEAFSPGTDPVPILQEGGWAPAPVWTGAENRAPPGFDPRTFQSVASRYTNHATRPTSDVSNDVNYNKLEQLYYVRTY